MFRRSTVIGLPGLLVVGLVLLSPDGAGSAALAQAPPAQARPGAAPPGTHGVPGTPPILRPEEIEKRISPEERESLRLPEPTWVAKHGKVHPDVRAVLETGQMPWIRFRGWWPMGFDGTAYVAVYLRDQKASGRTPAENETAIRQVESRVLSRLTAAEFAVVLAFRSTPAILGYVSAEGLAKLAKEPDVVAVGLDDAPVPERPPGPAEDPPPRGVLQGPTERRGKVELPVYEALAKSTDGYVELVVSIPCAPLAPGASWEAYEAREAEARALQNRVLSSLTAEDCSLKSRSTSCFDVYVNSAGLAKLATHPDVHGVATVGPPIPLPKVRKGPH